MDAEAERPFNPYSAVTLLVTAAAFVLTFLICRRLLGIDAELTGLLTSMVTLAAPVVAHELHKRRHSRSKATTTDSKLVRSPLVIVVTTLAVTLLFFEQVIGYALGLLVLVVMTLASAVSDARIPEGVSAGEGGVMMAAGNYADVALQLGRVLVPVAMVAVIFFACRRAGLYISARPALWTGVGVLVYLALSTILSLALGFPLEVAAITFYVAALGVGCLGGNRSREARSKFMQTRAERRHASRPFLPDVLGGSSSEPGTPSSPPPSHLNEDGL